MKNNTQILGLDIGTNSIGWAVFKDQNQLTAMGTIEFPRSIMDKTPTPKNVARRTARLGRRRTARLNSRRKKVLKMLINNGLLPEALRVNKNPEGIYNEIGDPYALATKGLREELTSDELGRVLMHSAQRRGFLSNKNTVLGDLINDDRFVNEIRAINDEKNMVLNDPSQRKTGDDQQTESTYLKEISELDNAITNSQYDTLREFLHHADGCKRNRAHSPDFLRTDRAMWNHDLKRILSFQQQYHPVLTTEFCQSIEDVIFFQRPVTWDRNTISNCPFVPKKKVAALGRLESQNIRYLQDINYLKYTDNNTGKTVDLSPDDRAKLVNFFDINKKVTFSQIRKLLGLDKTVKFNLEVESKTLKGNHTNATILEAYPGYRKLDNSTKLQIVDDLLTISSKKSLLNRLITAYDLTYREAVLLTILELESGYAAYSVAVIKKILPFLNDGMPIHQARDRAGYASPKQSSKDVVDRLKAIPKTNNPIVDKGLSEVRKIVNALITQYGPFGIIRIEMARDFNINTKRGQKALQAQLDNKKSNEDAKKHYDDNNGQQGLLPSASTKDIIKYKLWKQQDEMCVYSGQLISVGQLYLPTTEVDHIIPKSRNYDDSFNNKALCFTKENRDKGNKTPYEKWGDDTDRWPEIVLNVNKMKSLSNFKKQRILSDVFTAAGISSSALNDTRYICKVALDHLKTLGATVTTVKGFATAICRANWKLNDIISTDNTKNREDPRHHAIDAAIIAMINPADHAKITNLVADVERKNGFMDTKTLYSNCFPVPYSTFTDDVERLTNDMVPARRVLASLNGQLHEETGLSIKPLLDEEGNPKLSRDGRNQYFSTVRKTLDKTINVGKIADKCVRALVEDQIAKHGNDYKSAFSDPTFTIKKVKCIVCEKITADELKNKYISLNDGTKYCKLGNLHHTVLYIQNGKFRFQPTYLITARQRHQAVIDVVNVDSSNGDVIMVLYTNSIVSILNTENVREYYYVTGMFGNGKISLQLVTSRCNCASKLKEAKKTKSSKIIEHVKDGCKNHNLKGYSAKQLMERGLKLHKITTLGKIIG